MSKIYTSSHKIKFTEIVDKYKVNKSAKAKISSLHSKLVNYVFNNFKDTKKYKQQVVDALNMITYSIYADEMIPFYWHADKPFENFPEVDRDLIEETLGDVYLTVDSILWDIKPTMYSDSTSEKITSEAVNSATSNAGNKKITSSNDVVRTTQKYENSKRKETSSIVISPTPKQDLYIQPPSIPQFDYSKPWMKGVEGADDLVIYTSLPEIPTKQNEISVTTDLNKMTTRELMNLYPNCTIHTRSATMYQEYPGIKFDSTIGLIIPIEGFSEEQVIDNIIKYPHIFKPLRYYQGKYDSFYLNIEIDGELHSTLDIWDSLPESKVIPRQSDFVKEYVVRRYLLERDVKHVAHKYPMHGTLLPYLTLFMSPTSYIEKGYNNVEEIAKQCVLSRVSYKQSRNPVIRRLSRNA